MEQNKVVVMHLVYPIGANSDPTQKTGLTHFMEHCLVKAKVKGKTLIGICGEYGAELKVSTGLDELRIEIKVLSIFTVQLLGEFIGHMKAIPKAIELDRTFIDNEKSIILCEMNTQKHKGRMEGSKILGTAKTLRMISIQDIRECLIIFQNLKPKIQITDIEAEDLNEVEKLVEQLVKSKEGNLSEITTHTKRNSSVILECSRKQVIHRYSLKQVSGSRFCFMDKLENDIYYAALSVRPDIKMRKVLRDVQKILLHYLNNLKIDVNIQGNCELGILNFFIAGSESDIKGTIDALFYIEKKGFEYYCLPNVEQEPHILTKIHQNVLHRGRDLCCTPLSLTYN